MVMKGMAISAVWRRKQEKRYCSPLHTSMTEMGTGRRRWVHRLMLKRYKMH